MPEPLSRQTRVKITAPAADTHALKGVVRIMRTSASLGAQHMHSPHSLNAACGRRRATRRLLTTLIALCIAAPLAAQNIISVPFTQGIIGTRGSSSGTANNVLTYQTLGIARTFFIQNSSTNTFELQGNDIPGTLRIVRTSGAILDIPASANWRNSGGTTYLLGILPRPSSPITYTYGGGSINITDGTVNGGTSVGGYIAGYVGATLVDGNSTSGNAAQSQLLSALNEYLATVIGSRPSGPVTVTAQSTTSRTPTIAGTATLGAGEALTVIIGGTQYSTSTTPALSVGSNAWSLALASPLSLGTYDVVATITNTDGFTLSDATINELVVSAPTTTLTIGGSFTASDKTYDGTVSVTANATGLSLIGINGADDVTIAGATFAFTSAAAGGGRQVSLTAVTLGGAQAAGYAVSLAGAPTATATINQRAATISGVSAASRTYDGTLLATLTGSAAYGNLAPSETFAVGGTPSATFASSNVGNGIAVTVTGYAAPSANYTVTQPTGLTANITARALVLTGSFTASAKVFDGSAPATIATNLLTLSGVVPGDSVTLASVTSAFTDATAAASRAVTITTATLGGVSAGNYTVSVTGAPTTTAPITPAPLTLNGAFSVSDKTSDGSTVATITGNSLALVGLITNHPATIATLTAQFSDAMVGTGKIVSLSAVALAGSSATNYTVTLTGAPTSTASILAAGPPSSPIGVIGVGTSESANVTWSAPAVPGCSAIRSYGVEYSRDGGAAWSRVVIPAPGGAATLPSLQNNLPYLLRIDATNDCGTSAPSTAVSFTPIGVTLDVGGAPRTRTPGTASITASGTTTPLVTQVVEDSVVTVARTGGVSLSMHVIDSARVPLTVDSTGVLTFEQEGRAMIRGAGFRPGSLVTLFFYSNIAPAQSALVAQVVVTAAGTFDVSSAILPTTMPGAYTLQVNGIDASDVLQSVTVGVEVTELPPTLTLTATPDKLDPAPGDTVTITLRITNQGTGAATNVEIPRAFSEAGFRIIGTAASVGAYDDTTQIWLIPRIEAGTTALIRITAIVTAPVPLTPPSTP